MKIQMTCYFRDYAQGEVYDVDKEEGERLIGNKLAEKYMGAEKPTVAVMTSNKSDEKYVSAAKKNADEIPVRINGQDGRWKRV